MANFVLKVKTKTGQIVVNTLTPDSTVKDLKQHLSKISNIPVHRLHVLVGFPPKILDLSKESTRLSSIGIVSGDSLILEEKQIDDNKVESSARDETYQNIQNSNESLSLKEWESQDCPGILMKHIVPADNSCLFTSMHFVINGKEDETGTVAPWMRELVAETVLKDPDNFSEAVLGKPCREYCNWIKDDKSWGGAIELAILSDYYGIEIAVVDTTNAIINRFGEDKKYAHRVFLLFDGIHYDPLYLEPLQGGSNRTIFPSDDERLLLLAETLAKEAKSSRQYTDVYKFTLKCLVCNVHLSGQVQAQQHAQATGHQNFGEYNPSQSYTE